MPSKISTYTLYNIHVCSCSIVPEATTMPTVTSHSMAVISLAAYNLCTIALPIVIQLYKTGIKLRLHQSNARSTRELEE